MANYETADVERAALVRAQKEADEARKHDFLLTFGSESGQRVLAYLIEWSGVFAPSFVPGDIHATAFNDGIKNAVLYILSLADRNNLNDVRCLWKCLAPPQGQTK